MKMICQGGKMVLRYCEIISQACKTVLSDWEIILLAWVNFFTVWELVARSGLAAGVTFQLHLAIGFFWTGVF
jgi:hypothetical protein